MAIEIECITTGASGTRGQTKQGQNPAYYSAFYSSVDRTKSRTISVAGDRGSGRYAGGSPNRLTSLRR